MRGNRKIFFELKGVTEMKAFEIIVKKAMKKEEGLDGILVTIGLCIIALLLCVVMRDSLTEFIQTIVGEMTVSAKNILSTPGAFSFPPMYL
jgi:hypothetical protein